MAGSLELLPSSVTRSSRSWIDVQPKETAARHSNSEADARRAAIRDALLEIDAEKTPRLGQVECLYHLIFADRDVLFQAATGYGKSMIWQYTTYLAKKLVGMDSVTIMISPLNSLTAQQIANLDQQRTQGIAITAENANNETYRMVARREYTHICISPELVCSRRFAEKVIQGVGFKDRRIFLMVDEVHCIANWQTWRHDYGRFGGLRLALGPNARAFGTSATLNPIMRDLVVEKGPFSSDLTFIDTTTDRPEIFIEIRTMQSNSTVFEDLRFLVPSRIQDESGRELRKTLVFFDSRQTLRNAHYRIRQWLVEAGLLPLTVRKVVRPYYATLSSEHKSDQISEFQTENSNTRILLATDAVGMGINIAGVELVIQFGVGKVLEDIQALSTIVQRMGRAARQLEEQGVFVWLLPPWVTSISQPRVSEWENELTSQDLRRKPGLGGVSQQKSITHGDKRSSIRSNLSQVSSTVEQGKVVRKVNAEQQVEKLHPTYKLIFYSCPRRALLQYFHHPESIIWELLEEINDRCCSRCNPDHPIRRILAYPQSSQKAKWNKWIDFVRKAQNSESSVAVQKALQLPPVVLQKATGYPYLCLPTREALLKLREKIAKELNEDSITSIRPKIILPDNILERLAILNQWVVGEHGMMIFKRVIPDFELFTEYGERIQAEVAKVVQFDRLGHSQEERITSLRQYRKKIKNDQWVETDVILKLRDRQLRERYPDGIPKSELPGDEIEQQRNSQPRVTRTRIHNALNVVGRVDNISLTERLAQLRSSVAHVTESVASSQRNTPVRGLEREKDQVSDDSLVQETSHRSQTMTSSIRTPSPRATLRQSPVAVRSMTNRGRRSPIGDLDSSPISHIITRLGRTVKPTKKARGED